MAESVRSADEQQRWTTLILPVAELDCAECAQHVEQALRTVPGVLDVEGFPVARKVAVVLDPTRVDRVAIERALARAGYTVGSEPAEDTQRAWRRVALLSGVAVAVVLGVVAAELAGLVERANQVIPWPIWLLGIAIGGWPVFRDVARASWQRRVTAHTLMTIGALAAMVVGAWAAAAIVVLFMRLGSALEEVTGRQAGRALRELAALAPQLARVERDGSELEVPAGSVAPGEIVLVRTGEAIPVDGTVLEGTALVDEAALTGEPLPRAVAAGDPVYAATVVRSGSLRIRAIAEAAGSTFARIVRLVEAAEGQAGRLQRVADRFSGWYLPVVVAVALLTSILRRDALAVAAVLVVSCSCAFALATPMAFVATIGRAARRGVLIKGGAILERLARADVLLLDKTGTLTLGRPMVTDVVPVAGRCSVEELLSLAAAAEHAATHPFAESLWCGPSGRWSIQASEFGRAWLVGRSGCGHRSRRRLRCRRSPRSRKKGRQSSSSSAMGKRSGSSRSLTSSDRGSLRQLLSYVARDSGPSNSSRAIMSEQRKRSRDHWGSVGGLVSCPKTSWRSSRRTRRRGMWW